MSIAASQDLDARGVRTLKGTGSVYVVLDSSVGPDDDHEVYLNLGVYTSIWFLS